MIIGTDLLDLVLAPYRPNCRYVRSMELEPGGENGALLTGRASFSIGESCYIDDTGHFNAVELNISYNQIAYLGFGGAVAQGWLPGLGIADLEAFRRRQLPHFLILKLSSEFRAMMDARAYRGTFILRSIVEKPSMKLLDTAVDFEDGKGGRARCDVLLGLIGG